MRKNSFIILGVLAIVAVLAALQLGLKPKMATPVGDDVLPVGALLLPDFEQLANDIDSLEIIGAGDAELVTLNRSDNGWGIAQRGGYPASWSEVRNLLRALGQTKVIAPKTAREALYPRLGLADISDENTGGGLLRWGSEPDQSLIIGIEASDLTGRYVRQPDSPQSYLVDQALDVKTNPSDWLDKAILDWQASNLREVTIRHADGDVIRIQRENEDALEMQLQNIPDGRELSGQWAINGIANSLVSLGADDVRTADNEAPESATRALFISNDGINLVISLYQQQQAAPDEPDSAITETPVYLARLEVSLEPGAGFQNEPEQAADGDTETASEAGAQDQDPQLEVEQLNARLAGWEYVIPDFKYNSINKRLEDLLKPLPVVETEDALAGG